MLAYSDTRVPFYFDNNHVPDPLLLSTTCCLHAENGQDYEPFVILQKHFFV